MADNTPNLTKLFSNAGTQSQQQGTGYTNLNSLLQANQGNQLGEKVAGNIQSQIGNVQSQLGQQQQAFQTSSNANKLGSEADVKNRNDIINKFSPSSSDTSNSDQTNPKTNTADMGSGRSNGTLASSGVAAKPTAPSDTDVSSFQRYVGGQYTGPKGLADTSGLTTTAQQLQGQVSNLTPSGTQELLRRSVGGDRYTQGQQQLDSLLMNRSALTPVARQASQLGQTINRANLAASGQGELLKNQAAQFGTDTTNQLNQAMTGIDTNVQGELTSAQNIEKARQQQLTNLTNTLQGDLIPKLDANGQAVIDANGQPVMERKLTGNTDPYARMDQISGMLKDQGLVNQNQYEALFGKGAFTENKSAYDTNLANVRKQEVLNYINNDLGKGIQNYENLGASGQGALSFGDSKITKDNLDKFASKVDNFMGGNADKYSKDTGGYNSAISDMFKSGQLSDADISAIQGSRLYSNPNSTLQGFGTNIQNDIAARASALEAFKSATGAAGRSTLEGTQDNFYKTLANSLNANTTQAQNLNAQGVASDAERSNYTALNKLLGNNDSSSKYQNYTPTVDANGNPVADATRYQAGGINLDAAQIKKALGY